MITPDLPRKKASIKMILTNSFSLPKESSHIIMSKIKKYSENCWNEYFHCLLYICLLGNFCNEHVLYKQEKQHSNVKLRCVCVLSHSVVLTLCNSMDCNPPGKNTRVGCHFLLQGIFPTQGSNLSPVSSVLVARFFTTEPPGKP